MKKIITPFVLLVIILFIFNFNIVQASDVEPENPTVNLTYTTEQQENKVIYSILLGDFSQVPENSVMTAVVTLDFYNNQITSIDGNAYDGWKDRVSAETKTVMFETDSAKPNTKIGEIVFNLNTSNVTETTQGVVAINELNISDGEVLDETYPRNEFSYVLEPEIIPDDDESQDDAQPETPDDNTDNTNEIHIDTDGEETNDSTITEPDKNNSSSTNDDSQNQKEPEKDTTTSPDSKLPQTGIGIALGVSICIVVVVAVIGIIRYKTIKIK